MSRKPVEYEDYSMWMEEVPAHVHPGLIVPDMLTRQHKHRSGLIGTENHETCVTDIHCRHFNLSIGAVDILRGSGVSPSKLGDGQFRRDQPIPTAFDTHLDLHRLLGDIACYSCGDLASIDIAHMDDLLLPIEDLSSPRDDYIRWYQDVMQVHISNPIRHDTWTFGYQPAGVYRRMMTSMLQEVDDITTGVLEGPPSPPTQYTSVMRKVQTIIH
ncbi:hypothetical protein M9H77_04656 [Catharanthus roseus]|uniref:Uncharacterized protein n=1 Tax=Catharanthus roseus TaxID=4058 RepID=A0ACC0CF94_CATRO|nr:hypothetical protein M9H77_04656 [Catharanthus roseus]